MLFTKTLISVATSFIFFMTLRWPFLLMRWYGSRTLLVGDVASSILYSGLNFLYIALLNKMTNFDERCSTS